MSDRTEPPIDRFGASDDYLGDVLDAEAERIDEVQTGLQAFVARFSGRQRRLLRWRKQLAALLSSRYGLGPGGVGLLLEDDARCVLYLQRFLGEHQVPYTLPFYDPQGRYLFAAPAKVVQKPYGASTIARYSAA